MIISKADKLKGCITIPGDKSITHRAIMMGSLAKGKTIVTNYLNGADCISTMNCFKALGVDININDKHIEIIGNGLHSLKAPDVELYTGNSGTTTRIISGILAGQKFESRLNGDESIQKRPMQRIIKPLTMMNANISSIKNNGCAPLRIVGSNLKGIEYNSPVASAQVKSSILFAGLYADSNTTVIEPNISRNHTEIMMKYFGADINISGNKSTVSPEPILEARNVTVPGDISSAAYFIVAGLITPNSEICIKNVGINETRDGIIKVCQSMGGNIALENINNSNGETIADIIVKSSELHGTTIEGSIIPTLIDEIPVIAVMAAFAKGKTIIKDAAELKVKESNRIDTVTTNLQKMNVNIIPTDDGMIIEGGNEVKGTEIDSYDDHRIAMAFTVAALNACGDTKIINADCVNISYPSFYNDINSLR